MGLKYILEIYITHICHKHLSQIYIPTICHKYLSKILITNICSLPKKLPVTTWDPTQRLQPTLPPTLTNKITRVTKNSMYSSYNPDDDIHNLPLGWKIKTLARWLHWFLVILQGAEYFVGEFSFFSEFTLQDLLLMRAKVSDIVCQNL